MLYFAYGSNLNHQHIKKLCPNAKFVFPAYLNDYRLAFRYKSIDYAPGGVADIVFDPGAKVWGGVYEITEADLKALDNYERIDEGEYRRIEFEVKTEFASYLATSYEVIDKLNKDIAPVNEYKLMIIQGAKDCGLPKEYIKQIKDFIESLEK